jgi:hypothetical protein
MEYVRVTNFCHFHDQRSPFSKGQFTSTSSMSPTKRKTLLPSVIYSENRVKPVNAPRGLIAELQNVTAGGTYVAVL